MFFSILTPQPAFSPLVIPGATLWVDMNDPNGNGTIPANGTAITSIIDKSGNIPSISQSTASRRAIFTTNVQSGKSGLFFDGVTSQRYYTSSTPLLAFTASNTIFSVSIPTGSQGTRRFIIENIGTPIPSSPRVAISHEYTNYDAGTNISRVFMNDLGGGTGTINIVGNSLTLNTAYIYRTTYNGTTTNSFNFVRNGINQGTANVANGIPTLGNSGFNIGTYRAADNRWFHGYILEIIVYKTFLNTTQIAQVEQYLTQKWGIT
ncbi:MAG: hypothetical protein VKL60_18075 [Sphaerospermopsis sp.]|nr:hypothetical protein [Sphaerospermopsis sp.]